jgi:hypothetical protein
MQQRFKLQQKSDLSLLGLSAASGICLVLYRHLTRLIAWEEFVEFSLHESFRSYNCRNVLTKCIGRICCYWGTAFTRRLECKGSLLPLDSRCLLCWNIFMLLLSLPLCSSNLSFALMHAFILFFYSWCPTCLITSTLFCLSSPLCLWSLRLLCLLSTSHWRVLHTALSVFHSLFLLMCSVSVCSIL